MQLEKELKGCLYGVAMHLCRNDVISIELADNSEEEYPTESALALLHVFTAYALLTDTDADTLQGDELTRNIYDVVCAKLDNAAELDYKAFDLFIWSELC